MGKPWQWLKLAPLLYPLVYAHGQQHVVRPAPALACTLHNSFLAIGGACEKGKFFWPALRDCRYSSLPPRVEHEEGDEEEGFTEEEESSGSWNHEEHRSFGGANPKREQEAADVDWLKLTDRELQMQCRVETLRSSGPGGQHRNKTESAVRLLHLPTGCVAFAAEDRSQHKNRTKAFKRLREVIALEVRRPVELEGYTPPLELMRILPAVPKTSRKGEGGQKIGPNHDDFVQETKHTERLLTPESYALKTPDPGPEGVIIDSLSSQIPWSGVRRVCDDTEMQGIQPLLDLLEATKGSISECAAILGLSTGALSRLIVSNRMLWKGVNNLRATYNLKALRGD